MAARISRIETSGFLAIMHVDIEASTALATRAGDEVARRVVSGTKGIVRDVTARHGGREVDAVGDAMMLTFASARGAIGGAMAVQEAIAERECENPAESLRVRIGINVGEVLERDAHPFGAAVNAGARVMANADGGEVLVSEMVKQLAGTIPGATYRDRGRQRFKGFDEPWRLYQVVWPGAPEPRPRPRRLMKRRTLLLATALVAAVGVAFAVVVVVGGSDTPASLTLPPNSVGLLDPRSQRVVAFVHVGQAPNALASANGTLWVADGDQNAVTRIDERTHAVVATVPLDGHPTALTADSRGVWVAELPNEELVRIDAQFDRALPARHAQIRSLLRVGDSLWDTTPDGALERRDPGTGGLVSHRVLDRGADWLAEAAGLLWVHGAGAITAYDPRAHIPVGSAVAVTSGRLAMAGSGSHLWLVGPALVVVDAQNSVVADTIPLQLALPPFGTQQLVAATRTAGYVADPVSGIVVRVPLTGQPRTTLRVGATPRALLADGAGVWIAAS